MGADYGFVTTRPDTVHGDRNSTIGGGYIWAQKFTLSASGTFNLTEIGAWGGYGTSSMTIVLGVFTHDAANDCPESLVTNSTSDAITVTSNAGLGALQYHTYGTQPQITGGSTYWIVCTQSANFLPANTATGGAAVYRSGTYPNWPTSGDWETHTDSTLLGDFYAVYEAAATSQFARPSSDVADGNWLNEADSGTNLYASIDEETASDVDYIKSGASPANDTCTVGLGALSTPVSGTTTMRIRAKFL